MVLYFMPANHHINCWVKLKMKKTANFGYLDLFFIFQWIKWWAMLGLNQRPLPCEGMDFDFSRCIAMNTKHPSMNT